MKRGDIFLVSLDPTSGHEQQGTRPVLIVSPDDFNQVRALDVAALHGHRLESIPQDVLQEVLARLAAFFD